MRMGGFRLGGLRWQNRKERDNQVKHEPQKALLTFMDSAASPSGSSGRPGILVAERKEAPPSQSEMLGRAIRIRQLVDIVLEIDWSANRMDVRPSIIHDINNQGQLYLAQTSPPMLQSQVGKEVELTFLNQYRGDFGGRWLRVGYRAPLLKIVDDFWTDDRFRESVLVFPPPKELALSTARIAQRVEPTPDMDISLRLWPSGRPLTMIDLSQGGVRFSHPRWMVFGVGTKQELTITTAVATIHLTGQVIRNEQRGDSYNASVVQFADNDNATIDKLRRLVSEMARHHRAILSGLE